MSDIIKSEKLYPRYIFRNIYYQEELSFNNNFYFEIIPSKENTIIQDNNKNRNKSSITKNKNEFKTVIINNHTKEKGLSTINTNMSPNKGNKKTFNNQYNDPENTENLENKKGSIKIKPPKTKLK